MTWEAEDTGPFCRHLREAHLCDRRCAECGHLCSEHDSGGCWNIFAPAPGGEEECPCPVWREPDA